MERIAQTDNGNKPCVYPTISGWPPVKSVPLPAAPLKTSSRFVKYWYFNFMFHANIEWQTYSFYFVVIAPVRWTHRGRGEGTLREIFRKNSDRVFRSLPRLSFIFSSPLLRLPRVYLFHRCSIGFNCFSLLLTPRTILINNFNAQRQRSTRFSNRGVFFSDEIARSCLQPPSRSQKQRLDRTRWRILFHP